MGPGAPAGGPAAALVASGAASDSGSDSGPFARRAGSSGSGDPDAARSSQSSRRLHGPALRTKRRLTLAVTTIPAAGFLVACTLSWRRGWFGPAELANLVVLYMVASFGITIGFHRLFTHKGFEAPPWLRAALAIAGSMALEGPVLRWVADHRRHHAHSDEDGDPHSPHVGFDRGWRGQLRGLWHAHMGWLFADEHTPVSKYARDLQKDPLVAWIDARYAWWAALSLALPALIGLGLAGTLRGAATGFLWGGLARIFLIHHATWSVNSICHCFGSQPFRTGDASTNNWALALVTMGESWHNNHHAFPRAAIHGIRRWQVDWSGLAIRALERCGIVRDVQRAAPELVERLRADG